MGVLNGVESSCARDNSLASASHPKRQLRQVFMTFLFTWVASLLLILLFGVFRSFVFQIKCCFFYNPLILL